MVVGCDSAATVQVNSCSPVFALGAVQAKATQHSPSALGFLIHTPPHSDDRSPGTQGGAPPVESRISQQCGRRWFTRSSLHVRQLHPPCHGQVRCRCPCPCPCHRPGIRRTECRRRNWPGAVERSNPSIPALPVSTYMRVRRVSISPPASRPAPTLVVEEPNALLHKRDAELLRRRKHQRIVLAPTWCRNILRPRPPCAIDIVREWELYTC